MAKKLNHFNKKLIKQLKITYMSGKGSNCLVPVLFPPDTLGVLKIVRDPEVREKAGVLKDNMLLFQSTRKSEISTDGWANVNNIVDKLELKMPENINATSNRQTLYHVYGIQCPSIRKGTFFTFL